MIDKQFVSEFEEIYLIKGYYPKQISVPRLENEITYARMHNEENFFGGVNHDR